MDAIFLYLFIIGLFFGSFYNVVALRISKNESILFPGSHCVNCNHRLSWYELIPVFSFIALKGKCKNCKIKISLQYPIVEILTGILFAFSYYLYGFSYMTLISIVLSSVVIITLVTDFKFMVILDEVLIVAIILLIILYYFYGGFNLVIKNVFNGVMIFGLVFLIKYIGDYAFKQESLGWGDVKLSFIAGFVLDIKLGVIYIFLASFMAFPYALYITLRKKEGILPFGPFLVSSMLLLFWNKSLVETMLWIFLGGIR